MRQGLLWNREIYCYGLTSSFREREMMQKKLTLGQTWKQCLAMWKWIAEQKKQGRELDGEGLKAIWMEKYPRFGEIENNCFFCEYDTKRSGDCSNCPGKLVSKRFDCINITYDYYDKPIQFYRKLVELNEKRKGK